MLLLGLLISTVGGLYPDIGLDRPICAALMGFPINSERVWACFNWLWQYYSLVKPYEIRSVFPAEDWSKQ